MSKLLQAAVLAALALPIAASAAAVDYFLKIDGIPGESSDARHKDEIEIESWSWGVSPSAPGTGAGRAASRPCVSPMAFSKMLDKATPLLMANAVSGMVIPKATLVGRKAGGKDQVEFFKVEMKTILISSYQAAGSTAGVPTDQFALDFASMTVDYYAQKADGTLGDKVTKTFQGGC